MLDTQMIGRCGAYCGDCEWKERMHCAGCQACNAKVFWGECAIAKCSIEKGYLHCGYCEELPCQKLQDAFDNPEHGDSGERLANLRSWAKGGQTYLRLTRRDHK